MSGSAHLGLDVLSLVSVHECVSGLLKVAAGGTDVCDHHRATVSTQSILNNTHKCVGVQYTSVSVYKPNSQKVG